MFPTTIKLSQYFRVPEYVAGYLEWGTGLLRVNVDHELWEAYRNNSSDMPSQSLKIMASTITHETYHFLQIAVTGFMYRFALEYFQAMRKSITAYVGSDLTEESIYKVLTKPPPVSAEVQALLRSLRIKGPTGISKLDIIESAAYLYEHRTHFHNLSPEGYKKLIKHDDPPEEYFLAYLEAERILGSIAFDNFLISSVIALCFEEPQNVFPDVLACLKSVSVPYRKAEDLSRFIMSVQEVMQQHAALGTSAEYMARSGAKHPIYQRAVHTLNGMADTLSPVDLISRADAMSLDAARTLCQPMIFNRNRILVPPGFSDERGQDRAELELQVMVFIAAMFMAKESESHRPSRYYVPKIS